MPPKGMDLRNLWEGKGEVFIAPYDNPEDMRELGEVVRDAITIEEDAPICTNGSISLTFKARVNSEKLRNAILRIIGAYRKFRKPRKTTYKTIRHDCAKRNGRR